MMISVGVRLAENVPRWVLFESLWLSRTDQITTMKIRLRQKRGKGRLEDYIHHKIGLVKSVDPI
jgi:hypothetical protein